MRVLFVSYPEKTIFQYFAPMAWALRTAGHDVRVATQPKFADVVTQAGLTAVPVGGDRDIWRLAEHRTRERDATRAGLPAPFDVVDEPDLITWEHLSAGYARQVDWWFRMKSVPLVTELVDYARYWRPDLVVWEPTTFAGPIAAKAVGAAHARMLYSVDVFGVTRDHFLRLGRDRTDRADPLADWLGGYADKYGFGFAEDMVTGHFTIDQIPGPLRTPADLHYVPVRYVPYGGPAVVPKWLWQSDGRPRVALTLGLSATERFDGYTVGVGDILDALADLDVEVVATIADRVRDRLGATPGNARIVPYVPLHALVPTCAAVIHHAGAATLATTSLHAVPQLALPFHFDQPALGRALAAQGAGIAIHSTEATGEHVRDAVLRLLREPGFRDAAVRLRDDVLATPSPTEAVGGIEGLVDRYRDAR
ncbi:activator-dependent family glycosyltransferase [Saccharothrix australiensis]|uniref:Glycosyltransferase (Activator-dependent family) n=1 Tax=Saccharothrix australiensis TaxID=2072 RepID=A0A495W112_9PSEU|nr:activator-dependent family glycosyltransferase [Saccharothrix australiensis]RKT54697.1 glycosyltransferase (activator-dependent family) [Saccharothrix australiensis]